MRETTFNAAGHEVVILGELPTQSFPKKSEGIFERSPAFYEKHQFSAFSSLCESEEIISARPIDPVEDVTVYERTSPENFPWLGPQE